MNEVPPPSASVIVAALLLAFATSVSGQADPHNPMGYGPDNPAGSDRPAPEGVALARITGPEHQKQRLVLVHTPSMEHTVVAENKVEVNGIRTNGILCGASFSSDGRRIVFMTVSEWRDTPLHVWVMNNDGSGKREVARHAPPLRRHVDRQRQRLAVDWAADGYIYWALDNRIWRVNPDAADAEKELVLETEREEIENMFHLSVSNDGKWFGVYSKQEEFGRGEPNFLIRRGDGRWWQLDGPYASVSPNGERIVTNTFRSGGQWAWGARCALHDVKKITAIEGNSIKEHRDETRIKYLTTPGAYPEQEDKSANRNNQLRFASNSNDYIVSNGESGPVGGGMFLHYIPTDESWFLKTEPAGPKGVVSSFWVGDLPEPPGGRTAADD